jgi:hypothetical protein
MSDTTQFTTYADLYNGLLKAIRSDRSNSETVEQAKRYINTALADMHIGFAEKVPWALRDYSFSTTTTFTDIITVVGPITNSDSPNTVEYNTYTLANVDTNDYLAGHKIAVTSTPTPTSTGLEGTVRDAVLATSPAVVKVYQTGMAVDDQVRVYQDEVEMPADFMRLAGNTVKLGSRDIPVIGRVEFRHRFAGDYSINRPQAATLIDSTDIIAGLDNRKLRLFPIPNAVERGHITYVTKLLVTASDGTWQQEFSADADEPIVPRRYRHAIFYHALSNWYRDRKDDVRSQEAKAEYVEIMNRITNDVEAGQSNMSIRPNTRGYRRKSNRPYGGGRGGGRRYDFGAFDELR